MNRISLTPTRIAFSELIDLASEEVGGEVLFATDDFFAGKENLLKPLPAIFIEDKYTEHGKWMDGWESRRKRLKSPAEHDFCVVKLGLPGTVKGVNIDTSFFTGNFPEYASLEAYTGPVTTNMDFQSKTNWVEILPKSALMGGTQNFFPINADIRASFLRLRIYPDGGVARLRVHGIVIPEASQRQGLVDVSSAALGAVVVTANDMYFGNKDHLIFPGRAKNMGEGWETRRKRGPGHDFIILKLAGDAVLERIEVDTDHFKGNFPDRCSIDGLTAESAEKLSQRLGRSALLPCDFRDYAEELHWESILGESALKANTCHEFLKIENKSASYRYLRLNIFPDGGVSRLRTFGRLNV